MNFRYTPLPESGVMLSARPSGRRRGRIVARMLLADLASTVPPPPPPGPFVVEGG